MARAPRSCRAFWDPGDDDASEFLAVQLIAAKLNVANGSDSHPIAATINAADGLLAAFAGSCPTMSTRIPR